MENLQNKMVHNDSSRKIITSKNDPALAEKMKKLSQYFIQVNDQLYKDLANK